MSTLHDGATIENGQCSTNENMNPTYFRVAQPTFRPSGNGWICYPPKIFGYLRLLVSVSQWNRLRCHT